MLSIHNIDADLERLTTLVTALGTLAGVGYTAFQNARQRKQTDQVHKETLAALKPPTEEKP